MATSAFAVPARYTYGNAARTVPGLLTPGLVNFDSMLAKNFTIKEHYRAQFRWEAYNTANTPLFGAPNGGLGNSNFGISTATSRRIMQLGLKLYW